MLEKRNLIKIKAARNRRVRLSEEWRERIRAAGILQRLDKAAMGEIDITATQLRAAEIVLRKTIPDLQRTELTGNDGDIVVELRQFQRGVQWADGTPLDPHPLHRARSGDDG